MGNIHSRSVSGSRNGRRKLPPELIYEMAKWIPLKVERRPEKLAKSETEILMEKAKKRIVHMLHKESTRKKIRRKLRELDAMCITYIGPGNESLLMASFDLTYFLLQRSHGRHQMIENLANDFKYELYPRNEPWPNYSLIEKWPSYLIKKKAISATDEDGNNENFLPISMVEMMRHLYFGHRIGGHSFRLFAKRLGTMPDDFQPDIFVHSFIEYTKQTTGTEMISGAFEIHLSEHQYECAIEAMQCCYGHSYAYWRNVHNMAYGFELYLFSDKDANGELLFMLFFKLRRFLDDSGTIPKLY